jgi:hypothetical protein
MGHAFSSADMAAYGLDKQTNLYSASVPLGLRNFPGPGRNQGGNGSSLALGAAEARGTVAWGQTPVCPILASRSGGGETMWPCTIPDLGALGFTHATHGGYGGSV